MQPKTLRQRARTIPAAAALEERARLNGLDATKSGPKGERLVGYSNRRRSEPWTVESNGVTMSVSDSTANRLFALEVETPIATVTMRKVEQ